MPDSGQRVLAQMQRADGDKRPALMAHPLQAVINIDGRLDEGDWQQAEYVTGFLQSEPAEGAPSSQRTEVRVIYGPGSLYVGAFLHDDDAQRIQQTLGRRDQLNRADWFIISIDSYFDLKTAYVFAVNAAGIQYDAIRTGSGGPGGGMDESWNAVWASNVQVTLDGWIAEMRIPYSMLRFAKEESQTWGIHFERRIPGRGEQSQWPLVRRTERANLVARYGLLEGLNGISPRPNIQIRPYTVSSLQREEHPDNPGSVLQNSDFDGGGDLKLGLGSNFTLDATINPDFGQVESDPAELNLTAFETFFQEKRPFFVEGTQIYEFDLGGRGNDLLYTRRIGAEAPIIGAAKLSGRTGQGLSFGVLGATTGHKFDPDRRFGVIRLSQQFSSLSSLGGILTGFDSPDEDGGRLRSLAGGTDWDIRLANNKYNVSGFLSFTHRRNTTVDFQETGLAASLGGSKRRGTWKYEVSANLYDDKFDPNDLGRQRRNNYFDVNGDLDYEVNGGQPFGPFQRGFLSFDGGQQWSYRDGLNLGMDIGLRSFWTFQGFQRISIRSDLRNPFGGYDLFETRGLGPRAQPTSFEINGEFETDDRRPWRLQPEVGLTFNDDGGKQYQLTFQANWNVGSRLTLTGDIDVEWDRNVIAWSSNESFVQRGGEWLIGSDNESLEDLGEDDFVPFNDQGLLNDLVAEIQPFDAEGHYHLPIFGSRDTRAVDFTIRSSITFTRNLSLQIYGQLFVARGRYDEFQVLKDRDTLVPFDSFPKRDDFTSSSFQTNTVLRWEYRPGSTLYLVWTHGRRGDEALSPLAPWGTSPSDTPIRSQISNTFDLFPTNVFLVKFDYTFLR